MSDNDTVQETGPVPSFFDQPGVQCETIPVGPGIPLGIARVSSAWAVLGGAYGAWGKSYDNDDLQEFIAQRLGRELRPEERLDLSQLGFDRRHHPGVMSDDQHLETELVAASRMITEAAHACGWEPQEVEAVLVGMSGPASHDFLELVARRAGIPERALKVSVHKACDGSVGSLNLALNPELEVLRRIGRDLSGELMGKKVLVGGVEGLSRYILRSSDINALQLFGTAAGLIGLIPGQSMKFLVGKDHAVFDEEGVLAVHMYYPHPGRPSANGSLLDVAQASERHLRVAGLMHEPEDGSPLAMAGMMGMVKLFVRSGVQVVDEVYRSYQALIERLGGSGQIAVAIVHHANYKINQLKEKHLQKEGIHLHMPWLLREFGNVSAASNMIAFLRWLPRLNPGDHVMFDGFGAGTYYDVLVVAL